MYQLVLRLKCGALAIITGYDEATMYLEEYGNSIAYIIEERFIKG